MRKPAAAPENPETPSDELDGQRAVSHVRAVTRAAGSSFYWAMRILPADRRDAMFALYAFCREVDDIADGDAPRETRTEALTSWRHEIDAVYDGVPGLLTAQALVAPVRAYGLPREEFHAVIDGMQMDVDAAMLAPSWEELRTYCRRVAGAVGLLSIRIFGTDTQPARDFAVTLGDALQLTNILRDLAADAALGRVYLPRELLSAHGISWQTPEDVLRHQALPLVCREVAAEAARHFDEARRLLASCDAGALRPAIVMMMSYRRILDRLVEAGWTHPEARVSVSKAEKLWIALRYGIM